LRASGGQLTAYDVAHPFRVRRRDAGGRGGVGSILRSASAGLDRTSEATTGTGLDHRARPPSTHVRHAISDRRRVLHELVASSRGGTPSAVARQPIGARREVRDRAARGLCFISPRGRDPQGLGERLGSVGSVVDLGLERRGRKEQPQAGAIPSGALVEEAQSVDARPRARSIRTQGASSFELLDEVLGRVSVYLHLAAV
jgi:hypothetical protein